MAERLRVLLVDVCAGFLNPTRGLLPALLGEVFDVEAFGPGFVPSAELRRGLPAFLAERPPVHVALASEHVLFSQPWRGADIPAGYDRYFARRFPLADVLQLHPTLEAFSALRIPRAAVLLSSDYYNFPEAHLERLRACADLVIGWGPELLAPLSALPRVARESFAARANDRWLDFAKDWRRRIVSCPHFIAETEFAFSPLEGRKDEWSVLGSQYADRREAVAALRGAGFRVRTRTAAQVFDLLMHLKLMRRQTALSQSVSNLTFRAALEERRYAFTCGSGLGYAVRKFFEIPALGTVLACTPCQGFGALGFSDGENAVDAPPERLADAARALAADPARAQRLAAAGRELVWSRHRMSARAAQLEAALRAVVAGRFEGARWEDGRFALAAPAHAAAGR